MMFQVLGFFIPLTDYDVYHLYGELITSEKSFDSKMSNILSHSNSSSVHELDAMQSRSDQFLNVYDVGLNYICLSFFLS